MDRIQAFDFSVDLAQALLWQYNVAPALESLIETKQLWYDENQSDFWDDWYNDVFNLETANEFGLSVWALILNVPLFSIIPPSTGRRVFGFQGATGFDDGFDDGFAVDSSNNHSNFNNSNFGNSTPGIQGLTLAQRRLLLRLRYFNITMRPSVPQINAFLKNLFKDEGSVYVLDGLNMSANYVFTYTPSSALRYVINNFDVLPRPAGVKLNIVVTTRKTFGFGENHVNFDNGNFGA